MSIGVVVSILQKSLMKGSYRVASELPGRCGSVSIGEIDLGRLIVVMCVALKVLL